MSITKKRLIEAGKDLNELYEDGDAVNVKGSVEEMAEEITTVSEQLTDGEKLFKSTVDLMVEMELDVPAGIKIKKVQKAKAEGKGKGTTKPKSDKPKAPGVIASIAEIVSKTKETKKAITIEKIVSFLEKRFPERDPERMIKTVRVQLGGRLKNEKGMKIEKTDKGHICK